MGVKHQTKEAIQTILSLNKTWYGIDLFKVLAAVLIVNLHTYNLDWGTPGLWVKAEYVYSPMKEDTVLSKTIDWLRFLCVGPLACHPLYAAIRFWKRYAR